jgi:toxin ParE1/3/4
VSRLDFRFSGPARRELSQILKASLKRYGSAASGRYQVLVGQAVRDLTENPGRIGTHTDGGRVHYHLRHSRSRVTGEKVREPRHYLVVRIDGSLMTVLAIVYDGMVEGAVRRIEEGEQD